MMLGIVLLSQGVPFIHSGQEFCRTKNGVQNSYASSDLINRIDWDRKDKYELVVDYTKDMIQLRKRLAALRMRTQEEIEKHAQFMIIDNRLIEYTLKNVSSYGEYEEIKIYVNATKDVISHSLKDMYEVLANANGLVSETTYVDQLEISPLSIIVLAKKGLN